jgi:carbonic anhydrase
LSKKSWGRTNRRYASDVGAKGKLALPPARGFAIMTCMDARIEPAKLAGVSEGDAHVIRNAGGRGSDDAIRSLVISHKLLGTREWFGIHHTGCGMELFTDSTISDLLRSSLNTATFENGTWKCGGRGPGSSHGEFINWLTTRNQSESVVADVEQIRRHPLGSKEITIYGYVYQVEAGRLVEVPEAVAFGQAS